MAPIKTTTSARQTRRFVRVLRGRVESGRAGDLRGAKIGPGRRLVVAAMGPSLFRWRRHKNDVKARVAMTGLGLGDGFGTKASIDRIGELLDYL